MLRAWILTLCLPAVGLAQEPRLDQQPVRRKFDGVAALIGDVAILRSQIEREVDARVAGLEAAGEQVTPEMREGFYRSAARELGRDAILAQGTNALGGASREMLEQEMQRRLREYQQEQIQKFGSFSEYARQLEMLGRTWDNVAEEQRTQQLALIHQQQEFARRFRNQFTLAITPSQIRDYYEKHIEEFVRSGSADVDMMTIQPGSDSSTLEARARVAAQAWAEPDAKADAVANEYGGLVTRMPGVRDVADDIRLAFIKEFAETAKVGEVSVPRRSATGRAMLILKLVARNDGRSDELSDPEVQRRIANVLAQEHIYAMNVALIARGEKGLSLWPASLFAAR